MRLPFRILVLQDDTRTLSGLVHMLRDANYLVTGAATSDAAKRLLAIGAFDLLITDARLEKFNGSNIVRHTSEEHPGMAVLVMTDEDEPLSGFEARRSNAEVFRRPLHKQEFLSTVSRCLRMVRRPRRWERKRVETTFRVHANGIPAGVIDVCYGGLRLEFKRTSTIPERFDVEIGAIGLHLPVETVWTVKSADGMICGAALTTEGSPAARTWRAIVDRLG